MSSLVLRDQPLPRSPGLLLGFLHLYQKAARSPQTPTSNRRDDADRATSEVGIIRFRDQDDVVAFWYRRVIGDRQIGLRKTHLLLTHQSLLTSSHFPEPAG